ncbi:hypothetical protein NN561_001923 [Cricetulus griseus]
MRIFAPNHVVAKSRFWYFVSQLKKMKKSSREIVYCGQVFEKSPLRVKNFGIRLRCDSRSGTHNIAILEAPVTEPRFLEQLQELDTKAAAVREQEARGTAACADVRGVLDRLRVKAVTKIREFILQKIYSFRKPMTNYQIPQTALLKYRSPPEMGTGRPTISGPSLWNGMRGDLPGNQSLVSGENFSQTSVCRNPESRTSLTACTTVVSLLGVSVQGRIRTSSLTFGRHLSRLRLKAVPRLGQYQGFGHTLTPQNVAAASKLCEDVMIDVPEEQQPSDAGQREDSEDTLTSQELRKLASVLVSDWMAVIRSQSSAQPAVLKKNRRRGRGWTQALGPEQLLRACEAITAGKVDLSSWREKIARDMAGASWGNGSGEEEEEEDGPVVLVEQQTDSAMEPTGPSRERYKDGVVTIGCVGFPNVGKSSLINGLVGRKVVSVSRTPGHTRYFQTYFLTPSVKLCDCPGLIFPSLLPRQLQVLAGIYPISQIQEPYTAVGYLASRIPVQALLHLRHPEAEDPSAEHPWCAWDICEAWAEKRGYKTAKAARNDVYRAANSLLRLAVDGRLSLCFHPPGYSEQRGESPVFSAVPADR